jgi:hypothetical protein
MGQAVLPRPLIYIYVYISSIFDANYMCTFSFDVTVCHVM